MTKTQKYLKGVSMDCVIKKKLQHRLSRMTPRAARNKARAEAAAKVGQKS